MIFRTGTRKNYRIWFLPKSGISGYGISQGKIISVNWLLCLYLLSLKSFGSLLNPWSMRAAICGMLAVVNFPSLVLGIPPFQGFSRMLVDAHRDLSRRFNSMSASLEPLHQHAARNCIDGRIRHLLPWLMRPGGSPGECCRRWAGSLRQSVGTCRDRRWPSWTCGGWGSLWGVGHLPRPWAAWKKHIHVIFKFKLVS